MSIPYRRPVPVSPRRPLCPSFDGTPSLVSSCASSETFSTRKIKMDTTRRIFKCLTDDCGRPERTSSQWIWEEEVTPRMQIWLWRVSKERLPLATLLVERGICVDVTCPRCKNSEEDGNHLLFGCPLSQVVWNWLSEKLDLNLNFSTIGEFMLCLTNHSFGFGKINKFLSATLIITGWCIWNQRNRVVFHGRANDDSDIRIKVEGLVSERFKKLMSTGIGEVNPTNVWDCWRAIISSPSPVCGFSPPTQDWVKLSFDGSFVCAAEPAGAGFLIRDANGKAMSLGYSSFRASSAFDTQIHALFEGVSIVSKRAGQCRLIIEGDSPLVTHMLRDLHENKGKNYPLIMGAMRILQPLEEVQVTTPLMQDYSHSDVDRRTKRAAVFCHKVPRVIRDIVSTLRMLQVMKAVQVHTLRKGNNAADRLANEGRRTNGAAEFSKNLPRAIKELLDNGARGVN